MYSRMVLHHKLECHTITWVRGNIRRSISKPARLRVTADDNRMRRRRILNRRCLGTSQECIESFVSIIRGIHSENHARLTVCRRTCVRSDLLAESPYRLSVIYSNFECWKLCIRRPRCNWLALITSQSFARAITLLVTHKPESKPG